MVLLKRGIFFWKFCNRTMMGVVRGGGKDETGKMITVV